MRVQIKARGEEQPISHFYSDDCVYVGLVSDVGGRLDLRHLRYTQRPPDNPRPSILDGMRQRRLHLECKYDYPSSEKFFDSQVM
ncbi:hypothetical protein GCM10027570_25130 [Streptomonospora sediminis]